MRGTPPALQIAAENFPPRGWCEKRFFYNRNPVVDWNPARAFSVDTRSDSESSANISLYINLDVCVSEFVVHSDWYSASAN